MSNEKITTVSQKQLELDYSYKLAQQQIKAILECGLISLVEFNKITLLNRETFSPFLAEIIPTPLDNTTI